MAKYATHTCYKCQLRRPANQMKQIEVTQKSGSRGWGLSWNPKKKNSLRISAPRNYHRKSVKWVCANKKACGNPTYYTAAQRAEKTRQELSRNAELAAQRAEKAREEFLRIQAQHEREKKRNRGSKTES